MPNSLPDLKLLLVDDHPLMRLGVRQALGLKPGLAVAGEASTGALAVRLAAELKPDLVVVDIHLPDINGIEASRQILAATPAIKIVIFSSDGARDLVDEALQAGVCGYILKSSATEELEQAIDQVMAGRLYLSPGISEGILEDYRKSLVEEPPAGGPLLSERERALLRLVAAGRRNKEIAAELGISIKSVEAHRSRLMKKLACPSSAELIRYAIREGLASP